VPLKTEQKAIAELIDYHNEKSNLRVALRKCRNKRYYF